MPRVDGQEVFDPVDQPRPPREAREPQQLHQPHLGAVPNRPRVRLARTGSVAGGPAGARTMRARRLRRRVLSAAREQEPSSYMRSMTWIGSDLPRGRGPRGSGVAGRRGGSRARAAGRRLPAHKVAHGGGGAGSGGWGEGVGNGLFAARSVGAHPPLSGGQGEVKGKGRGTDVRPICTRWGGIRVRFVPWGGRGGAPDGVEPEPAAEVVSRDAPASGEEHEGRNVLVLGVRDRCARVFDRSDVWQL
jgi:hypothetical protein